MSSPEDVKYIRITDYGEDGIEPNHEFVTAEVIDEKFLLEDEDVLFARSGATAGKTFIYTKDLGKAIFAGYCIRFRFDKAKALPKYVYFYTKTLRYAAWVNSMQRPAGQPNINKEEFKSFVIPLPPLDTQRALVAEMESARAARRAKLSQAEELLKGIDNYLLKELGLNEPVKDKRNVYAVRMNQLGNTQRINADYFHPERMAVIRTMQSKPKGIQIKRLVDIVDFIRDADQVSEDKRYFGLANVQSNTGVLVETFEDEAEGQCFEFIENDVLFARLRPYLNKVYRAEISATCSTEFHVLRLGKSTVKVLPDYLATVLRSSLILTQTAHMMTGNTHPRLANEDVTELLVPIPNELSVQEKIVGEVKHRQAQARALREEAEREWQSAKEKFEKALAD